MTRTRSLAGFGLAVATAVWGCTPLPSQQAPSGPATAPAPEAKAERQTQQTRYDWFTYSYHQRSGCLRAGEQDFRFKVYRLPYDPAKDSSQLDPIARSVVRSCVDTVIPPRRGEYATPYPLTREAVLIVWRNVSNGQYGSLMVYTASGWDWIRDNSDRSIRFPAIGSHTIRWTSGGARVFITVRQPAPGDPSFLNQLSPLLFTFGVDGAR